MSWPRHADGFEQRIEFEPGHNFLHETGPQRRGQHGMHIRFVLIGPEGATQFVLSTSWTPLGEVDRGAPGREPCHVDHDFWHRLGQFAYGSVRTPSGRDLGYHWSRPIYDEMSAFSCEYVKGGHCFYDGSGLAAERLLPRFISEGVEPVWEELRSWYTDTAERAAEFAAKKDGTP